MAIRTGQVSPHIVLTGLHAETSTPIYAGSPNKAYAVWSNPSSPTDELTFSSPDTVNVDDSEVFPYPVNVDVGSKTTMEIALEDIGVIPSNAIVTGFALKTSHAVSYVDGPPMTCAGSIKLLTSFDSYLNSHNGGTMVPGDSGGLNITDQWSRLLGRTVTQVAGAHLLVEFEARIQAAHYFSVPNNIVVLNGTTSSGSLQLIDAWVVIDYTYDDTTIVTVNPSHGPDAGGNSVTITGTGFVDGASVTFGGVAATDVVVVSSEQITCKPPAFDVDVM